MNRPDTHVIVLFGATGDLAKRKLLPGLFHLACAGLLPERYRIIGSAPAAFALTTAQFRRHARAAIREFGLLRPNGPEWQKFEANLSFAPAERGASAALVAAVATAEGELGSHPRRLYHLAIPPPACGPVVEMLGASGLETDARVICEKPFGTDLTSARALNAAIHRVFDEDQIFRIDHFLGKESIDNILALRFANGLFEPIWNRDHISYVQIDVPETLSIEGRAAFYEGTGAFRDMVVTHLLQVLGIVAMEPLTTFSAKNLADEKIKVFDAMVPIGPEHVVRGQYRGYRSEPGVAKRSDTETFIALRAEIQNWRWSGVPFYLRTGKNLAASRQVITLGFRTPVLRMFPLDQAASDDSGNELAIDFSDPGSISARFLAKVPGPEMRLANAEMAFHYADSFGIANDLEGYERLILDAMHGNQALFTRSDSIERLWELSVPLLHDPPPVESYAPGSWGPKSIEALIAPYRWHLHANA